MAVEKLTLVNLSGPMDMVDFTLQNYVLNREFHLENAIEAMRGVKKLYPYDTPNPYTDVLQKAYDVMRLADMSPAYQDFSGRSLTTEAISKFFDGFYITIKELKEERIEEQKRVAEIDVVLSQIKYLEGVNESVQNLFEMKYVEFRFGRMPNSNYDECFETVNARMDVLFICTGRDDDWAYGVYFTLPDAVDQIDAIFATRNFERIRVSGAVNLSRTPEQIKKSLTSEHDSTMERIKNIDLLIHKYKAANKKEFFLRYSYVRFLSEAWDLRVHAGYRHDMFYIVGWIPEEKTDEYYLEFSKTPELDCILSNPKALSQPHPPVKIKKGILSSLFVPFLEMYGLPAYQERDPTLFLSVTYIILFGIMFGDVGQGCVLCLAGMLMWKKRKMWMGRIIACVGLSAIAFGFVYGSVFGYEHILPGFKVLEDGNALKILLVSVVIGAFLILFCMVMNVINGFSQRNLEKAIFSPNGIAGIVFYGGICAAALCFALGKNIISAAYIIIVFILPLFCMFAAEPLTNLLITRTKNWMPQHIGEFIVSSFFELFETLLAYVANTISFLRIGAFAISHAGMMSVVFLLSGDGASIPGVVIGNLIVIGIEAVLVCIQVMRLEFYELFGRFYIGGGRRFSPKFVSYDTMPQR